MNRLGEILVEWGLISHEDLSEALKAQENTTSDKTEPPKADHVSPMLSVRDVSRLLNVHANTVRRWSDSGILQSYRINPRGDRRFHKDEIARFMAHYNDFNVKR